MQKGHYQSRLGTYNKSKFNVENPSTVILLLYETALSSLRRSTMDLSRNNIESAHKNIVRAKFIVSELNNNLNLEVESEITTNLRALYNYIYNRLLEANINKNKAYIEECIVLLKNLYEGWKIGLKGEGREPGKALNNRTSSLNMTV